MPDRFATYCIRSPNALQWRSWDDGCVVRDDGSGRTHQLGVVAGLVLTSLLEAESGATAAQLALQLRDQFEVADEDGAKVLYAVQSALSEFERLGLIQPVPS